MRTDTSYLGAVSLETKRDSGAFERARYIRTLHSWTR